jgi:hypothetical protein
MNKFDHDSLIAFGKVAKDNNPAFDDFAELAKTNPEKFEAICGDLADQLNVNLAKQWSNQKMMDWQSIETADKGQLCGPVLLLGYFNSHGHWRTLRGRWYSKELIEDE